MLNYWNLPGINLVVTHVLFIDNITVTFLSDILVEIDELFVVMTQSLIVFLIDRFLQRYVTEPATGTTMLNVFR